MVADIFLAVLSDIFSDLAAHQIEDFFKHLFSGDEASLIAHTGNGVANHVFHALIDNGIDPAQLTMEDWRRLASLLAPSIAA